MGSWPPTDQWVDRRAFVDNRFLVDVRFETPSREKQECRAHLRDAVADLGECLESADVSGWKSPDVPSAAAGGWVQVAMPEAPGGRTDAGIEA